MKIELISKIFVSSKYTFNITSFNLSKKQITICVSDHQHSSLLMSPSESYASSLTFIIIVQVKTYNVLLFLPSIITFKNYLFSLSVLTICRYYTCSREFSLISFFTLHSYLIFSNILSLGTESNTLSKSNKAESIFLLHSHVIYNVFHKAVIR